MNNWDGKLTRIQAIQILENVMEQDDPYWENVVEDYYNEDEDTMPSVFHVYQALGISKEEYLEASGGGDIDWPEEME